MRIFIKLKPSARENRVRRINKNNFAISVKEPPVGGRANEALTKLLALYFDVPKTSVKLISGLASRKKVVEIV
ncbi:MAG: DUF167 domain-containing protein [Candidatus Liptonbacteria bacterium]|nr:DUF167 domain-containing protein [Candidatus Liptonbacteria bacterium]